MRMESFWCTWLVAMGVVAILYFLIGFAVPGDEKRALIWALSITLGYQIGMIAELRKRIKEENPDQC